MLLDKSFYHPLALSLALATVTTCTLAGAASAATFNLSYTSGAGPITATVEGTLQPDNNTVIVSSVSNPTFNGSPAPALPFVNTVSGFINRVLAPGILSLNGSGLDFIACPTASCSDGFAFIPAGIVLPPAGIVLLDEEFSSGTSYGSVSEVFVLANYSLTPAGTPTAVPEPATVLGLLSVAGVSLLSNRRKQEK